MMTMWMWTIAMLCDLAGHCAVAVTMTTMAVQQMVVVVAAADVARRVHLGDVAARLVLRL